MPLGPVGALRVVDGAGHREQVGVADEDQSHDQVVPHPEELEDRVGRERGNRKRDHDPHEDAEVRGAVDARRLDQVSRQRDEEVAQEKDREREAERRVREPDADVPVGEPEVAEEPEQGDERHLHRYDHERDNRQEDRVSEREFDPRERIGGRRAERERQERRRHRDHDAVHEARPHLDVAVEDEAVVVQREREVVEGRPPARGLDLVARPERRDRQAERRHQPEGGDEDQRQVDGRPGDEPDDPLGRGAARARDRLDGDAHVTTFSVRKRLMFHTINGMIRSSMTTAIAAP